MSDHLEELLDGARRRVREAVAENPLEELRARAEAAPPPASFRAALLRPEVGVIAEVKRASPSKGDLAPDLDAAAQARAYLAGGAAAISVLTEPDRFRGSLEDLRRVAAFGAPTLRKDFVVDPYQVYEAKSLGAAAVLVIVKALEDAELEELLGAVRETRLDAVVEVHDEEDLKRAATAGARIIGINARDLRSFDVDRDAFARLAPQLPEGTIAIAESGVTGPEDVRRYAEHGADAVLVGEALVTAEDPTTAVAELVAAGREAA